MVCSLKNICLKYIYNNMNYVVTEVSPPNIIQSLETELKNMRNCCVNTDYITAVKNNHVQCLENIHDTLIRVPWSATTMEIAAKNRSIDCLKYLYENGCPINNDICDYAAEEGCVKCLKYLHLIGMSLTSDTCYYAAYNGNARCLEYTMQNGCTWSELIFKAVIESQNLDTFIYAIESGYVFDEDVLEFLIEKGSREVLTYFFNNIETIFVCYKDLFFSMFFAKNSRSISNFQN